MSSNFSPTHRLLKAIKSIKASIKYIKFEVVSDNDLLWQVFSKEFK